MPELEVTVFDKGEKRCTHLFSAPLEVGRQRRASEPLYAPMKPGAAPTRPAPNAPAAPLSDVARLVVAETTEDNVGRQHALIEPMDHDRVRVTNLSSVQPVYFESPPGPPLMPKEKREVGLPQLLRLGTSRVLRLQLPNKDESAVATASLAGMTLPPGFARSAIRFPRINTSEDLVRREEVVEWFASVLNVLQADPATNEDYFKRAAKAVVEMVELDVGRVLFCDGGRWTERAVYVAPKQLGRPSRPASQTLLQNVVEKKRTFWETPAALSSAPASMLGLESLVASPILNRAGEVIGALYGEREPRLTASTGDGPITKLEAMLVELLAQGIAAGLSRVEEERKAGGAITLFEQFFGPALARFLAQTPGWEQPRQADVTLLFCDIKGFTRISRQLTPQQTYEWVYDVLNMLSQCVLDHGGVLVDYVGDEVMSMWGAPQSQADHARRACRAALDMMAGLAKVNERWQDLLGPIGEVTDLAVGLNSGSAQVGNVGSKQKFKYGAQGPTVNTASRVMNANKFFKSHVLMTRETWEQPGVKDQFHGRRLGKVLLNNVKEPIEVFEMAREGRADWPAWRDEYERALTHFETVVPDGQVGTLNDSWVTAFGAAGRILAEWRFAHQDDLPALVLLSRAVAAAVAGPDPRHPVWEFKEK